MNKIQIFVPISRKQRFKEVIKAINNLDIGVYSISVLFVIDNRTIQGEKTKYETKCVNTKNHPPSAIDAHTRRQRIADVFNLAKKHIDPKADYVFVFEDDSDIQPDTLKRLIETYEQKAKINPVGFVSGVQVGRWGFRMLGVWNRNKKKIWTLPYTPNETVRVHACGFYCYLVKPDNFIKVEYRRTFFGPDVNFGFDLSDRGYFNYCNMDIIAGHVTTEGTILDPRSGGIIELEYNFDNKKNTWTLKTP